MAMTPSEHMRMSADVQESRDAEYGSAYKRHGPAIMGLFPEGVQLNSADDHSRFAILTLLFGKLTRYCGSFNRGGHEDSLTDLIAYTAMLKEVDQEARERQEQSSLLDCDDLSTVAFTYVKSSEQAEALARADIGLAPAFDSTRHSYDPRLDK